MTVGTDTYITVDETDGYISSHFPSADANRLRWEALAETDKEIYLRNACELIEALPFCGYTHEKNQPLSFPRYPYQSYTDDVPDNVKKAQSELALWLSDAAGRAESEQHENLKAEGITSISMGSLSLGFEKTSNKNKALLCPRAKELLSFYLTGGY